MDTLATTETHTGPEHQSLSECTEKSDEASDLQQQLGTLADLDNQALNKLWQRCHRRALPPALSRDLIIRMVAHKLQEKALGGLTGAVKRKLKLLGEQVTAGVNKAGVINLKPGTKLVRSWRDRTYTVAVLDDGFEYDAKHYSSLSKIACEITGAHWSGPRFFGLKPRHKLQPRGKQTEPGANGELTGGTEV